MKLRSLSAALVMAGFTAVSTQANAGFPGVGDVPDLKTPEKAAFVVAESLLSAFAALIEAYDCANFLMPGGTGYYNIKVETEYDGSGYGVLDLLEMYVHKTDSSNKGDLWEVTGDGTIAGWEVDNYIASYGFDKAGSILWGSADMWIHNDLFDQHIIKDFWDAGEVSEKIVEDDGLEVITKLRYPRAKWYQYSYYERDNGSDGVIQWTKTQIAPTSANLGTMTLDTTTDGFGDGLETFDGLVTLTCGVPTG